MSTRAMAILDTAQRMHAFVELPQTLLLTHDEWRMLLDEAPQDDPNRVMIYRGEVDEKVGVAYGVTLKLAP